MAHKSLALFSYSRLLSAATAKAASSGDRCITAWIPEELMRVIQPLREFMHEAGCLNLFLSEVCRPTLRRLDGRWRACSCREGRRSSKRPVSSRLKHDLLSCLESSHNDRIKTMAPLANSFWNFSISTAPLHSRPCPRQWITRRNNWEACDRGRLRGFFSPTPYFSCVWSIASSILRATCLAMA